MYQHFNLYKLYFMTKIVCTCLGRDFGAASLEHNCKRIVYVHPAAWLSGEPSAWELMDREIESDLGKG
jgi:hypothetical protein